MTACRAPHTLGRRFEVLAHAPGSKGRPASPGPGRGAREGDSFPVLVPLVLSPLPPSSFPPRGGAPSAGRLSAAPLSFPELRSGYVPPAPCRALRPFTLRARVVPVMACRAPHTLGRCFEVLAHALGSRGRPASPGPGRGVREGDSFPVLVPLVLFPSSLLLPPRGGAPSAGRLSAALGFFSCIAIGLRTPLSLWRTTVVHPKDALRPFTLRAHYGRSP